MGKETISPSIDYQKTEFQLSLQDVIRQNKPCLAHRFPDSLPGILDRSEVTLQSLITTEDGQKNLRRINQLADNLNISRSDVETSFIQGMRYNVKAGYRLGFFDITQDNSQLLENLIGSYTLSFRQTLRSFDKKRDQHQKDSKFILEITSKLYLLKPDIYQRLQQKYQGDPFIDQGTIKHAITNNSADPELVIERIKKTCIDILERHQDDDFIDYGNAKYFAIHNPSNPEAAIQKAKNIYISLIDSYQGDDFVENWMCKVFAIHNPSNPQAAIQKAKKAYIELGDIYHDDEFVEDWIRKYFAIHNSSNPKLAIEKAKNIYMELLTFYQNDKFIDPSTIKYFAVYNPTNPQSAIEKTRGIYIKLKDQYQSDDFVENWMLKVFAIHNTSNPQSAVEDAKKLSLIAKDIYPNIPISKIKDAVVFHPDCCLKYLSTLK